MALASHGNHLDGPRTFANFIRDGVALPSETVQRFQSLDTGRHPHLTELRTALGLDLDLSETAAAGMAVAPRHGTPSDDELAAVLDAMYLAVRSTRIVTVSFTARKIEAAPTSQPIRIRAGEPLVLLVLANNREDQDIEFSAEVHGEGARGRVEARRTGSGLLHVGAVPAGSYLVPMLVVAGERTCTVDLPIECAPSGVLRVEIRDEASGAPVAARVYLSDAMGAAYPSTVAIRRDVHGNAWFHADGAFEARVSGTARLRIMRGIEYEPCELHVEIPGGGEITVRTQLKRWTDIALAGWRSGDVHVHLHYGGEYLLTPHDAALAQRAEDVHFLNMAVANQNSGFVHDHWFFEGKPHALSTDDHVLQWGEEYRNNFYGHICMFGIDELVPPICSGFPFAEQPHDLPANAVAADCCHSVGGTLSYAHPLFGSSALERVFTDVRTVEAKELPVDAILGKVDAVDVMSYPGNELETVSLWYRLLNCGLRLAATAGTDTFMNFAEQGQFSNPPAGDRVYARVDGAFTTQSWCAAVRTGRTFVTNGPVLTLAVNGCAIGDVIPAERGQTLRIEADARSWAPIERFELIVNGEVVAAEEADPDGRRAALAHELVVDQSCWIAARAIGPPHEVVLDTHLFAHTSPVYVTVEGSPVRSPDDAAYFVEWIERLIAMAREHGRYPDADSRDEVIVLFREARERYRNLM